MTTHKNGTITANGIDFAFIEKGDGPLMLLLHGFPDHAPSFAPQIDAFAEAGYRVVAPFMRGYAPTGPSPDGMYFTVSMGLDAVELIEKLGYDDAVVLGHDWGATAACGAAVLAPDRVSKLIFSAVPYGPALGQAFVTNPAQQHRSWYVFFIQTPLADMSIPLNDFAWIEYIWRQWSPGWDFPNELIGGVKKTLAKPGVLAAALGYYRSPFQYQLGDAELAGMQSRINAEPIEVPALYIHGADDGCIGVDISEGMEGLFPSGLQYEVVDGAGHFVHLEKPAEFNKLVLEFLGG
jgi:pimeloyl-ACP methyl ester carboxylesterase